ncbi:hypothetical protein ACHAXT_011387 [Thalassiosira profunda]
MDGADGEGCLPLGVQHNETQDTEEEEHFRDVCRSYQQYATFQQARQQGTNRRLHQLLESSNVANNKDTTKGALDGASPSVESIVPSHLLPGTPEHQQRQAQFRDAAIRNQFFLDNVLKYSGVPTSQEALRQRRENNEGAMEWATEEHMSKIDSVLKSVARDWSEEGREERSAAYERLLGALERYLPLDAATSESNGESSAPPKVAVPGSGLGRLAWEIYARGYSCQGTDFSLPMLLASDFMLNGCGLPGGSVQNGKTHRQFAISPWVAETKNVMSFEERVRTVVVPDVDPTSKQHSNNEESGPEFTMLAGEFLSLYSHFLPGHQRACNGNTHRHPQSADRFHAVVCSFFLDTAPSLPHYLLTIYHMLEDGGFLINFGPLMYHWSGHGALIPGDLDNTNNSGSDTVSSTYKRRNQHLDQRYLSSIDYTWADVRQMISNCGFEILEEEEMQSARYTSDSRSMMKVVYDCAFLVARKKALG